MAAHRGVPVDLNFPAIVIAGGLANKLYSLASEVENSGLPFIHLYSTRTPPNVAPYGVIWNSHPRSSRVWFDLVETIWKYTRFNGLLTVFTRRLL